MIAACSQATRWAMLERLPNPHWHDGPVVMLGDACHPTTPHMGQGAGMAIEDAAVLARCIDRVGGEDPAAAFRLYQAARFERTARIQRESHEGQWTRTGMDHGWLYGYDAMTVPLDPTPALSA